MKKKKLTRKEREYLRHRQEILNAALELFSKNGLHEVTMNQIAMASEFSVGTLYKFFKNKEDLYKELIFDKVSKFHAELTSAIKVPGTATDKIESWLDEKIRIFNDDRKFMRLYFSEAMGVSSNVRVGLKNEIKIKYEDMLGKIEKIFKAGVKQKVFKDSDPYLLALALEGISNAFLFEHVNSESKHEINAKIILNIFYHRIKTE